MAAVSVGVGLVKRGQAPPFSTGYLLLGGLASFGMCLAFAVQAYMLFAVTVIVPEPIQADPLWKTWLYGLLEILILAAAADRPGVDRWRLGDQIWIDDRPEGSRHRDG